MYIKTSFRIKMLFIPFKSEFKSGGEWCIGLVILYNYAFTNKVWIAVYSVNLKSKA